MFTLLERIIIDIAAVFVLLAGTGVLFLIVVKDALHSAENVGDDDTFANDYLHKKENSIE